MSYTLDQCQANHALCPCPTGYSQTYDPFVGTPGAITFDPRLYCRNDAVKAASDAKFAACNRNSTLILVGGAGIGLYMVMNDQILIGALVSAAALWVALGVGLCGQGL